MEPEILKGRVEHFNEAKGYGFIKDLVSAEKYFFPRFVRTRRYWGRQYRHF